MIPTIVVRYHLRDVIVGKIYFLLVRIKIKHMEIAIIKRETTGIRAWAVASFTQIIYYIYSTAPNMYNENDTVAKYEIMDGAPVRGKDLSEWYIEHMLLTGESIPIRLFLSGYDLTPTMKDINKKFSVRYFINLVLVDEEDRRYFKQQVTMVIKLTIVKGTHC